MKTISITLPRDMESAEIHSFADLHIGDKHCNLDDIKKRIEYVKNTPNAFAVINGDLCNTATKTSVSDIYSEQYSPMEELEIICDLFEQIKNKVLACCQGNHENRIYKNDGIDTLSIFAKQLGFYDKYARESALLFLKIGEHKGNKTLKTYPYVYSMYMTHGCGGGAKEGGKLNRLADLSAIVDADIYLMSHTHTPMIMKNSYFRTDRSNCTAHQVDRLFCMTSAELDYGGYGEAFCFKPSSRECPVITISGTSKFFNARL